jgi:uncharacterized protein YkwD
MPKTLTLLLAAFLLFGPLALSSPQRAEAVSRPSLPRQDQLPTGAPANVTPADIINAVNNLRLSRGLNALTVHPVLMEVAADQANALAASEGAVGHERPCGMTLEQDLLSRGFPLLGDLSLGGYRSENWVARPTVEEAMAFWQSDAEHLDTMIDPNRSHIGAAVAQSDQVYMALETALSTSSGQMQYDAYPILTGIPQTQAACYGMYTEAAKYGVSDQYAFPVMVNTAQPNGDVIHEVKYGQSLWSLAIQYNTTIAEIKRLNRLASDVISPGMKLLIKTGATQPPPDPRTPSPTPLPTRAFPWAIESPATASPASTVAAEAESSTSEFLSQNSAGIAAVIISFAVLLAGLGVMGKKKPR